MFLPSNLSRIGGFLLMALGGFICQQAFKSYDGRAFFGLSDLKVEEQFRTDGLLRFVRHPLYSGSIVLLAGLLVYKPNYTNLMSVSLMVIYFVIGIRFEERKLLRSFGKKYADYRKRTPMLIPRFRRLP
jgi:protein-S-isoprenylcysteine O-methyltransferase Ste14